MYKNIIFDFGGVVVQFNPKDFLMDHLRADLWQPRVAGPGPRHHHP